MESRCKSLVHTFLNLRFRSVWPSWSIGGGGGCLGRIFRNPGVTWNCTRTFRKCTSAFSMERVPCLSESCCVIEVRLFVWFFLFPRPHGINMFLNLLLWGLGSIWTRLTPGSWWKTELFPVKSFRKSHCLCFLNTPQICHVSVFTT